MDTASATGQHFWDAELYRLAGTVLLAGNKLDEGEASLQQAIRVAQAQQAKSLELRAARDLARLWGEQGRHGKDEHANALHNEKLARAISRAV